MDKAYDHTLVEDKIYKTWEENGYFKPEINPDGAPYSIILPPPNANAPLHFGHAMYVIEDVLIRYHRMKGLATLWVPGADHAGTETQFVFEKKLKEQGKSRLDYDRDTLFQMIWDYVQENRGGMENQLRRLGFSLDWSRLKFTMDPDIVKIVYSTFEKMFDDGLVYRANRLVNYCTFDGTSFSDLEVVNEDAQGSLYEIKYPIKNTSDFITVATTRPETLFGDVAVMVSPDDSRYKDLVGKTAMIPLIDREIPIIADEHVDKEFGTGAVKVTPNHDFNDYEVAVRNKLPMGIQVIGFDGKMINTDGVVDDLYVKQARKATVEKLEEKGLLGNVVDRQMVLRKCYKCKNVLEPLPKEQWYVKMEPLAKKAIEAVKSGEIKIHPQSFDKVYFQFLENIRDWNISRQNVWGIRIPAWFCENCSNWEVKSEGAPEKCSKCDSKNLVQDIDTFDTWFSSSQWPFATLQTTKEGDYEKFYPTTVMETGYDILRWWVARMAMVGIYRTEKVPFKNVVLHGLVNDPLGKKMSKSKGNVVNPMELVDQYGADAVRFALVYGTALGNDQALSYPKLEAMRKFSNKLWNIGRFIEMNQTKNLKLKTLSIEELKEFAKNETDREWVNRVGELVEVVSKNIDDYQFHFAADSLYEFIWHQFADIYVEDVKNRIDENSFIILYSLFSILLKLLHPFMPFITEEIYQKLPQHGESIMTSSWLNNG
ncbi:MAG TPA: valine--tRNA ligase [Patescibacteria group bacterium]|nr:valine--tRNA ligase [Patescibacteria group bacterium]